MQRYFVIGLALVNGMGEAGIADKLCISVEEATALRQAVWRRYPSVKEWLDKQPALLGELGYVAAAMGIRRHRTRTGDLTWPEVRWSRNFPLQGSLAVVCKAALSELAITLVDVGGRVLLTLHDSWVLEVPLERIEEAKVMAPAAIRRAAEAVLPGLDLKMKMSWMTPVANCWPPDGHSGVVTMEIPSTTPVRGYNE